MVTSLSIVRSYEKYDLLENTESAARVSWVDWDKYKDIPVGAVAPSVSESYFVARHLAEEENEDSLTQTHYIGTLNTKDGLGKITYIKSVSIHQFIDIKDQCPSYIFYLIPFFPRIHLKNPLKCLKSRLLNLFSSFLQGFNSLLKNRE